MLWLATVSGEILFGFEVVIFLLRSKVSVWTELVMGIPVGIGLSTVFFFGCSAIFGVTTIHLLFHTIALFTAFSLVRRFRRGLFQRPDRTTVIFGCLSLIPALVLSHCAYSIYGRNVMVIVKDPLLEELSLIHSFSRGVNSGFMNIFKIRHPSCHRCVAWSRWITALHSAMLIKGGASLSISLKVPSALLLFSCCFLMMSLAAFYLKSPFQSVIACFVLLFASGLGFHEILMDQVRSDKRVDYVHRRGFETLWLHPILEYLLGRRPSQMSLCLSISCLLVLAVARSRRHYALVGILLGLLPGVQHQAFISVALYVVIVVAARRVLFGGGISMIIAFGATALLQLLQYLPRRTRLPLVVRCDFALSYVERGCFYPTLRAWFDALGVFFVVSIALPWVFVNGKLVNAYWPSVCVFFVGNFVKFQDDPNENVLFFYPTWAVLASIAFVAVLARVSAVPRADEAKGVLVGISVIVVGMVVASAGLGLVNQWKRRTFVVSHGMEEAAAWICDNTPRKAIFSGCPLIVSVFAGKVEFGADAKRYGFNGTAGDPDKVKYQVKGKIDDCGEEFTGYMESEEGWESIYDRKDIAIFRKVK